MVCGLLFTIILSFFCEQKNMSPLKLVIMSATLDKVGFLENPRLFRNRPADVDVSCVGVHEISAVLYCFCCIC